MESFLYSLLAILGLGFLVFIHELGHFWIARREGMRVEAFSIGFGKPIYTWERNGVRWMICMLPFGGYVRIAGMQQEGSREPYEIRDGFYGKKPWQRIKVALAGPVVNIAFALVLFIVLWTCGGRNKAFSEFTNRIGWVDLQSPLYELGVRPGDVIHKYDGKNFQGFKDLLVSSLMNDETIRIEGERIDYITGKKASFDYTLKTYVNPQSAKTQMSTIGVLAPASYLLFDERMEKDPLLAESGIQPQDRILWSDGEMIFSVQQLSSLTNESTALLTVRRGDTVFVAKVPRVSIDDLRMTFSEKAEVGDWQYEADIKGKLQDLFFIPYNLSPTAVVEGKLQFLDAEEHVKAFQVCQKSPMFVALEEGDQILAIDGIRVHSAYQLLQALQERRVLLIVQREPSAAGRILWTEADVQFDDFDRRALQTLLASLGAEGQQKDIGALHLLNPIVPRSRGELPLTAVQKNAVAQEAHAVQKEIEAIADPEQKERTLQQFATAQKKLVLGVMLRDREVIYNPNPFKQFQSVLVDTWYTLKGLFSGYIKPKYMSGPVGIVQVVHQSWMIGLKEALFWIAVISLNLGIVNLLPIPVLDGGHIVFSLLEMVRKRPLRAKTMERLVIPFIGLLIVFFLYITYQDIARLLLKFF